MVSPAEAEKLILENVAPFHREDCPIAAAHRRILRTEIRADRDLPPFDRVTMDGFALRSSALAEGARRFRVEGVQAAGMRAFKLGSASDACIEIMTGAVLPEGADCIVPYEETTRDGTVVTLSDEALRFPPGNAIHHRGSDQVSGDVMVRPGTRLTGREIAVAAACGYATLVVTQLPKIAVVATGDELVEVESAVAAHQIRRSNDHALRAALIGGGYPNVSRFHLRDLRHEIEHMLWHIIAEYDVLVLCGGVSKGRFDYLPVELERQGVRKIFHGVAQRPGKPLWFGITGRHTPVFALPGNPVSAFTCLHRYVLPALDHASGLTSEPARNVALSDAFPMKRKLTHFVPVRVTTGKDAVLRAAPDPSNTSGDFAGLLGTDGFVELPPQPQPVAAGTIVRLWEWV